MCTDRFSEPKNRKGIENANFEDSDHSESGNVEIDAVLDDDDDVVAEVATRVDAGILYCESEASGRESLEAGRVVGSNNPGMTDSTLDGYHVSCDGVTCQVEGEADFGGELQAPGDTLCWRINPDPLMKNLDGPTFAMYLETCCGVDSKRVEVKKAKSLKGKGVEVTDKVTLEDSSGLDTGLTMTKEKTAWSMCVDAI